MAYELKNNTGSLWPNDRRREGKEDPQSKGTVMVDGVEYWVSGWTKETDSGTKWVSLAFRRKEKKGKRAADDAAEEPAPSRSKFPEAEQEDIPF